MDAFILEIRLEVINTGLDALQSLLDNRDEYYESQPQAWQESVDGCAYWCVTDNIETSLGNLRRELEIL